MYLGMQTPPLFVSEIIKCIQTKNKEERNKAERGQGRLGGPCLPGNLIDCSKFP